MRWLDINAVHTIYTYTRTQPEYLAQIYDRKEKKKIEISRPFAVQEYNKYMGGVDMMDRILLIALYPHEFKNHKWYLRIFFHLLNMSIVNSWILYKKNVDENMSLLNFKASIVWTMLELEKANKRGRKSNSKEQKTSQNKKKPKKCIPPEIRYDQIDHYPLKKKMAGMLLVAMI